jgi:S-DNA-T family DNA segregation ATPase FtsK/SpoIIIE
MLKVPRAKRKYIKKKSSKPTSAKSSGSKEVTNSAAEAREVISGRNRAKRQTAAIVILAFSLFLAAVVFVPGVHAWRTMHDVLFGLFGPCAFLISPLLIYIAVIAAFERSVYSITAKLFEALGLISLICAVIEVFAFDEFPGFKVLYNSGIALNSGGVIGVIGSPLHYYFGTTGAAITLILFILVFFLLVTGITLLEILNSVIKRAKQVREKSKKQVQTREENTWQETFDKNTGKYNIDIDLGPSSKLPLQQETIPEVFSVKKKSRSENNSGLDELVGKIADFKGAEHDKVVSAHKDTAAGVQEEEPFIYTNPPLSLLQVADAPKNEDIAEELKTNAARLVDTLRSFGVETRITDISRGPAVTRYELQPSAGVKISRITALSDDIALNLAAAGVRIEAPIPNKAAVGIEVPNKTVSVVHIREIIDSSEFRDAQSKLSFTLGRDIAGKAAVGDIAGMPHVLIAGATGSGKSVCINSIIISLLYKATPEEVKFIMVDPKIVELGGYNGIPHLLVPVVTDPKRAAGALGWAVTEMQNRYKLFADNNVRDIKGYNALARRTQELETMPQIVIIIDELADLIMAAANDVEEYIQRLAQKARAAGMHLVIATQRPSVDVITGVIKANIPSRIAFAVSSQVDSRTILDTGGAEKLLGRGDMLYLPVGASKPTRIQGCYVTDEEVEAVIKFVKKGAEAVYDDNVIDEIEKQSTKERTTRKSEKGEDDPMLREAIECVVEAGMASTSLLQRRLKLGYARAARIVDEMEARGIVGPFEGSKPRPVLINRQQFIEMTMNNEE